MKIKLTRKVQMIIGRDLINQLKSFKSVEIDNKSIPYKKGKPNKKQHYKRFLNNFY